MLNLMALMITLTGAWAIAYTIFREKLAHRKMAGYLGALIFLSIVVLSGIVIGSGMMVVSQMTIYMPNPPRQLVQFQAPQRQVQTPLPPQPKVANAQLLDPQPEVKPAQSQSQLFLPLIQPLQAPLQEPKLPQTTQPYNRQSLEKFSRTEITPPTPTPTPTPSESCSPTRHFFIR